MLIILVQDFPGRNQSLHRISTGSCILSYVARNLRISQPAWIYLSMLICTQNACDIQTISKCSTRCMSSYLVTELCTEQSGCKEQFM